MARIYGNVQNQLKVLEYSESREREDMEKVHKDLLELIKKYPEAILDCAISDIDLYVQNCCEDLRKEIELFYQNDKHPARVEYSGGAPGEVRIS